MVNVGFALVAAGQADKGLALIEGGIKKGNLKRLDDARLHLGVAYASAGKKDLAIKAFKSVQGTDGAADLARLWLVQTSTPMN
ncbi:TPR repeat containing protein [Oxalobacteraceae bacterium IMCC9480]|nr:TPR repeat containing protein [Oxalobacteraceae bacterium IMCC9480]